MPGAPILTPALILSSLHYGETSRIVRLLTKDFGVVSAIAKGALRPRNRFAASLRLLSEGHAHLLWSRSSDLHNLVAFDLRSPHAAVAQDLERFLAASVVAELVVRFVPTGGNPALYDLVTHGLGQLEDATTGEAPAVGLHLLWQLITELGVAPSVEFCAQDGTAIALGEGATFSMDDGGLLCANCGRLARAAVRLGPEDVQALAAFLANESHLPALDPPHLAAHRRLLVRWIQRHLGEGNLPALELWRRGLSP